MLSRQYIDHGVPDVGPEDAQAFIVSGRIRATVRNVLWSIRVPPSEHERRNLLSDKIMERGKHNAAFFDYYSCPVLVVLGDGQPYCQDEFCDTTRQLEAVAKRWRVYLYYPNPDYVFPRYLCHDHHRVRILETAVISHPELSDVVERWLTRETSECLWLRLECDLAGNITAEAITESRHIAMRL